MRNLNARTGAVPPLFSRIAATLIVLTASASAYAGGLPGPMDGESSRGKSYSRDVLSLFTSTWRSKCTLDNEEAWKADVARWRARANKLEEPADRTNFNYYFDMVEKWQAEEAKGIKGVGTWAELKKRFTDTVASTGSAADDPAEAKDTAQFEVALERSIAIRAAKTKLAELQKAVEEASTCAGRVGDFQGALDVLETRRQAVGYALTERFNKAIGEASAARVAPLSTEMPKTWSEARQQIMGAVKILAVLEAAPKGFVAYVRYGELFGISSATVADFRASDAALDKLRQTLPGHFEKVLGLMTLPPKLGTNPKLTTITKQVITRVQAKGKVVRSAMTTKTKVWDYKEVDKGDNRSHAVTEEVANFYYVQQPTAHTQPIPTLPTLKAEDICEIHSVGLRYFKKAGPSRPLKRWGVSEEGLTGLMLCKNAGKASSFKE